MGSDRSDHRQEIREGRFKADTSRRHSRSKARAQVRHVLEVGTAMCPLAALFVWIMSLFVRGRAGWMPPSAGQWC